MLWADALRTDISQSELIVRAEIDKNIILEFSFKIPFSDSLLPIQDFFAKALLVKQSFKQKVPFVCQSEKSPI